MKKKKAVGVTAASVFFIAMVGIILFTFKKNKTLHQGHSEYNELNGAKKNLDSKSALSLPDRIDQKIHEAATKIKNSGSNFSMPVGEFGTFL